MLEGGAARSIPFGRNLLYQWRFIDDLLIINHILDILACYPAFLKVTAENDPDKKEVDFLEVTLKLNAAGKFWFSLFDKRDEFPFICDRYVKKISNMDDSVIRGAFLSQVLRVRHVSQFKEDFLRYCTILCHRFDECGLALDDFRMVAKKLRKDYHLDITEVLNIFFAERAQQNGNYAEV